MRSTAMEDVFENEPVPSDLDGQPKHFNGSSVKNVSLRILSMPSSPVPPVAGVMPSSPSAISLSSTNARDTRHRTSKDRVSRKSRVSTINPGCSSGMVTVGENFPSTVSTIDEGVNDGGNSPTAANLTPCSNTTVVKKSKVDFVRFDSTEIHYTENEEVRKKISDEIKSVTSTVHGAIHQVSQTGNKYKITQVTDSTLYQALESISHSTRNVKELDLSGNLLSKIRAADLTPFPNLELLNLSSNVFYETVDLSAVGSLKTVDLNNNFVQEVIVGSAIQTLHAANNNISRVNCGYSGGQGQGNKRISLANNKIGSLRDLSDVCRSNVEFLDLKLNEIDMVDFAELAASQYTLKHLYLQYNFIFDIKNTQNIKFTQLETINISSNKLAFMGPEFKAAYTAKSINLSNNKLVLIDDKLKFPTTVTSFDLRGNGFQCDTLNKMYKINAHLKNVAINTLRAATGQNQESCPTLAGPYCCENLSAPFADRLIELKRKEHALSSNQTSEQEREECERENRARQMEVDAIKKQYGTLINEETRKNQEKIQLAKRKEVLEGELPALLESYEELKNVLVDEARKINIPEDPDLLQLLRNIVKQYEDLYKTEQDKQSNAIRDFQMYQQKETDQLEENARLTKQFNEKKQELQKANDTLEGLIAREQALAKELKKTQN